MEWKLSYEDLHQVRLHLRRPTHGVPSPFRRRPVSLSGMSPSNRHSARTKRPATRPYRAGVKYLGRSRADAEARNPPLAIAAPCRQLRHWHSKEVGLKHRWLRQAMEKRIPSEKEIFAEALRISTPEERASYLK